MSYFTLLFSEFGNLLLDWNWEPCRPSGSRVSVPELFWARSCGGSPFPAAGEHSGCTSSPSRQQSPEGTSLRLADPAPPAVAPATGRRYHDSPRLQDGGKQRGKKRERVRDCLREDVLRRSLQHSALHCGSSAAWWFLVSQSVICWTCRSFWWKWRRVSCTNSWVGFVSDVLHGTKSEIQINTPQLKLSD